MVALLDMSPCKPRAAERRWNLIVSFVNSEQFTFIGLLIRAFPAKMNTKSLFFSVGHSVGYSDHTEKMMKKPLLHCHPLCMN